MTDGSGNGGPDGPVPVPAPAAVATLHVRVRHRVAAVRVRGALLVRVRRGRKRLIGTTGEIAAGTGELCVVAPGTGWDVVNDPGHDAAYEALVLEIDTATLRAFESSGEPAGATPSDAVPKALAGARTVPADAELDGCLERLVATLDEGRATLARHRAAELLMLLAERGVRFEAGTASPDEAVRRLVRQRLQRRWTVAEVARALHLGESTLRRRLADAGGSFSALLVEERLAAALALLQSTDLPVGEIAARCGYEAHGRFSKRFRERYGFAPSLLRSLPAGEASVPARRESDPG